MKRLLVMLLSLGLVAVSLGSAEARRSTRTERTVKASYGAFPAPVTGCSSALGPFACAIVRTRTTESSFRATVTDAHGQPVYVEVRNGGDWVGAFCGRTTRPIAVTPGATLEFDIGLGRWLSDGRCPTHRLKTTGTITVTLFGRR